MDDLERVLRAHPFLSDLEPEHVRFLIGCARNVRFRAGEYLLREGDREDTLYLIREGSVAIEMPRPGGDALCVETVGPGDVLGVSLLTPAAAHLDCRARETVIALAIDNACLQRKMKEDTNLGFALSMRLLERTYDRLSRARLQHLDIYR
ncbi:MAG TPA: cyclic nucleotide-binding domain-containing protein [Kofleriaceae bacterium]|nr:cyclic nucleotide-binding domain-containing protein [Kofleriaceae bacterium]